MNTPSPLTAVGWENPIQTPLGVLALEAGEHMARDLGFGNGIIPFRLSNPVSLATLSCHPVCFTDLIKCYWDHTQEKCYLILPTDDKISYRRKRSLPMTMNQVKDDLVQQDVTTIEKVTPVVITGGTQLALSEQDQRKARRLTWKLDLWILPVLTIIYLLAAMDRSDIGNAQVAGMQKAIGATGSQWAKVVSLFYVGFIVGHPPGVYSLRKVGPPILLGAAVTTWGVMITLLMLTKNWGQAAGIRICIGFAEGISHAGPLYLSLWYTRRELATRGGIFYSAASLAGAFNGLIAYGIVTTHSNTPPYAAWQWLFLIEGVLSIGCGLVALFILPESPDKIKFGFSADEKRLALIRLQQANNTPHERIRWKSVPGAFKNPMWIVYTVILACTQVALGGLSSFLPSIVKGLGYTSVRAQLMTVPIYCVSSVTTVLFAYLSDKSNVRGPWLAGLSLASLSGYIMLIASHNNNVRYAGLFLAAAGQYPIVVIVLTWQACNIPNFTHRATMSAVSNILAQAFTTSVLTTFTDAPLYHRGLSIVIGLTCCTPVLSFLGILYVKWFNAQKPEATAEQRGKTLEELGENHPDFFLQW